MEMHLTYKFKDKYAIIAVLFEIKDIFSSELEEKFYKSEFFKDLNFPKNKGEQIILDKPLDFEKLFKNDASKKNFNYKDWENANKIRDIDIFLNYNDDNPLNSFYLYKGSLTTPPCEG